MITIQPPLNQAFWHKAPFLRLLIPFAAGICISTTNIVLLSPAWILFFFFLAATILFSQLSLAQRFQKRAWSGIAVMVTMFQLGILIGYYRQPQTQNSYLIKQYQDGGSVMMTTTEVQTVSATRIRAIASANAIARNDSVINVSGSVIIYADFADTNNITLGTTLISKASLQPIQNRGNPGEFDYATYCRRQGIAYQVYLHANDYRILAIPHATTLMVELGNVQQKVLRLLKRFVPGQQENAMAEALLIGYKYDIDRGILQAYANVGVIHVIAISGLHLALIFVLLESAFKSLKNNRNTRWLYFVLILSVLWAFTLISGASPSALRAAVMFSFVLTGKQINRQSSLLNTLPASAFLLLCYNPNWIWDAGFQLSYVAVAGIAIFNQPIVMLIKVRNPLLSSFWKAAAVTLAAQLATLPLCLYYFNRFPTWFLFTNLLVVPLSSIILLAELGLCIIAFFTPLANLAGHLISALIHLMNGIVLYFQALPFSSLVSIPLSGLQLVVLLLTLFFFALSVRLKNKPCLFVSLVLFLFHAINICKSTIAQHNQQILIAFNSSRGSCVSLISGRTQFALVDSAAAKNPQTARMLSSSQIFFATNRTIISSVDKTSISYFLWANKRVVMISGDLPISSPVKVKSDIVIISRYRQKSISSLLSAFAGSIFIFDGTNSRGRISGWMDECNEQHIKCHYIVDKGAFLLNLH